MCRRFFKRKGSGATWKATPDEPAGTLVLLMNLKPSWGHTFVTARARNVFLRRSGLSKERLSVTQHPTLDVIVMPLLSLTKGFVAADLWAGDKSLDASEFEMMWEITPCNGMATFITEGGGGGGGGNLGRNPKLSLR